MVRWSLLLLFLVSSGCKSFGTKGEIVIRNDIQDAEFNEIVVDQVVGSTGATSFKARLKPGEETGLPGVGITAFRVTREYADFSRIYGVSCPPKKSRALMKLIDIHLNRLPEGCKLAKAGELRDGIVRWK